LPGFGLRLSYAGAKAYFVMTRVQGSGKLLRVTIGKHPAFTLAKAREKAREIINLAAAGIDPRTARAEEERRRVEKRRHTFDALVPEFLARHVEGRLRASTAGEYRRVLAGPETVAWGGRPVAEINRRAVRDLIDGIGARGAPGAANLAFAHIRKFFNWCVEREVIAVAPTDRMRPPYTLESRERVLDSDEICIVYRAFENEGGVFGPLCLLLLLTEQRRLEVAGIRWDEIRELDGQGAIWELPGRRTKNAQLHRVPLSQAAIAILRSRPKLGEIIFTTTGSTPVSGFSRLKTRIDHWIASECLRRNLSPMAPWTLHDLRRTMITVMNEHLGIPPHIVEAVVNHISGPAKRGVAGVYNRALYLDDRKKALDAWADCVVRLTNGAN
jgi:integrase